MFGLRHVCGMVVLGNASGFWLRGSCLRRCLLYVYCCDCVLHQRLSWDREWRQVKKLVSSWPILKSVVEWLPMAEVFFNY